MKEFKPSSIRSCCFGCAFKYQIIISDSDSDSDSESDSGSDSDSDSAIDSKCTFMALRVACIGVQLSSSCMKEFKHSSIRSCCIQASKHSSIRSCCFGCAFKYRITISDGNSDGGESDSGSDSDSDSAIGIAPINHAEIDSTSIQSIQSIAFTHSSNFKQWLGSESIPPLLEPQRPSEHLLIAIC